VAWHTTTRDAITPIEEVDGRSYFANVGRTTSRGVEATLSSAVGRRWRVRATGSYLEARFGAGAVAEDLSPLDGNRLPGIPRLTARLGLTGSVAGVLVDLDHGVSSALTADDGNTVTVPGWAGGITNAALRWPATRAVTAFGSVRNLFDRAYAASVVVNGFGGRVIEPGSGRLLTLGVEIRLAPLP
jgi:iron complex outermembrane receptor protein